MKSAMRLASDDIAPEAASRFWRRVRLSPGCWEWTGPRNKKGYGTLAVNGRSVLAHRVAYVLGCGTLPRATLVLHACDNPPCVRPSHLSAGSNTDNMRQMVARGRSRSSRPGERNPRAVLTAQIVRALREEYRTLPNGGKRRWREAQGERLGVSERAIGAAVLGENWRTDEWVAAEGADRVREALGV